MTSINKCLNCTEEKEDNCEVCLKNRKTNKRISEILKRIEEDGNEVLGYDFYSIEKGY